MMRFAFMHPAIHNGEHYHARSFVFVARDEADLLAVLNKRLPTLDRNDSLVPLNDEAIETLLRMALVVMPRDEEAELPKWMTKKHGGNDGDAA